MADVFISYKSQERARVVPIAAALEARGYTVWWDLELIPGEKWKRRIKSELDAASCVIVIWTEQSVGADGLYTSEWVEKEAEDAHERGVLVPALLDAARIAWDHRQVQFADLTGWTGAEHPGLHVLAEGVTRLCGPRVAPAPRELEAWLAAQRASSAATYRSFASQFPSSRFASLAADRAAELEESADWLALGAHPSHKALAAFLRRWPSRRFAETARSRQRAHGGALTIAAAIGAIIALAAGAFGVWQFARSNGGLDPATRTLSIASLSAEPDLDPHTADTIDSGILGNLFLGLTTEDPSGAIIPGAAERWIVSDDGLIWTFFLREGRWSDGQPVTAQDFEFALRRVLDPQLNAPLATTLYPIRNAERVYNRDIPPESLGVRALDARTFEVSLEQPTPHLGVLLAQPVAYPVPRHVIDRVGDAWTEAEHFQSNGAFVLHTRTSSALSLLRNSSFYDAQNVCLTGLTYVLSSDRGQAIDMLRAGRISWLPGVPSERFAQLRAEMPTFAHATPNMLANHVVFNVGRPPFNDAGVRRALAIAIDRQLIAMSTLQSAASPSFQIVPPNMPRYDRARADWSAMQLDERRQQALALLTDADFGPNRPLRIAFSVPNNQARVGDVISANWRALAPWVQVEIIAREPQVHYAHARARDFSVAYAGWVADYPDPLSFLYMWETNAGMQNYAGYSAPDYDALLERAQREGDLDIRNGLLHQAEQILLRDTPMTPVVFGAALNLIDPRVSGFEANPSDIHRARWLCVR